MIDEIYDRHYQASRADMHSALGDAFLRFGRSIANTFAVLNRIEYSSPWIPPAKRVRGN